MHVGFSQFSHWGDLNSNKLCTTFKEQSKTAAQEVLTCDEPVEGGFVILSSNEPKCLNIEEIILFGAPGKK